MTDDDFNNFWEAYPRQTGIGAARKAWSNEIFFKSAKPEQMIHAAKAYKNKTEEDKTEERFTQKPSTFLQDQTYLDPDLNKPVNKLKGMNVKTLQEFGGNWAEYKQYLTTIKEK